LAKSRTKLAKKESDLGSAAVLAALLPRPSPGPKFVQRLQLLPSLCFWEFCFHDSNTATLMIEFFVSFSPSPCIHS
jgi:hypothetical protein